MLVLVARAGVAAKRGAHAVRDVRRQPEDELLLVRRVQAAHPGYLCLTPSRGFSGPPPRG